MVIKDAFNIITDYSTLFSAHKRALRGKRNNPFATDFDYHLASNVNKLQLLLRGEKYVQQPYRKKIIFEPKMRLIEAPAYQDRIVHHAIHFVLEPFYERFFINDSYASRKGRGIHRAAKRVQYFLRKNIKSEKTLYVCKIDISKYYASINHEKLLDIIKEKIHDKKLVRLLNQIIGSTDSGNEHDNLFEKNSYYFTKGRRGIPIGNLTSQLFANIYLHKADMYAKQQLKIRHYVRYMDDILFFHHNKHVINNWMKLLTDYLYEELYLTVNPRKIRVYPARHGVSFVGYVIYPYHMRLRGSSAKRFKKRYKKQLDKIAIGQLKTSEMQRSFASWKAHASHANCNKLIESMELLQKTYKPKKKLTQTSLFNDL